MKIKIGNKLVGKGNPCFIIAEAGVNHNGSLKLAKKLVDIAKEAGTDAVKFQTFKAENVVIKNEEMAEYQKKNTGKKQTQLEMLKELELDYKDFLGLKKYCDKKKIIFLSTPYDEESADFLGKLGVLAFKISSSDLNNIPLMRHVAKKKRPIIISTGASYLKEVKEAVRAVKKEGNGKIILLHTTSLYPTPLKDVNLKAILTLKKEFNLPTGYSDHTLGINVSLVAVALGIRVIEKHFTLDKNLPGPDHQVSLEPPELKALVQDIRSIEKRLAKKEKPANILKELDVEIALGNGIKKPVKDESEERALGWRSIVASKEIPKGTIIRKDMLGIKRPGTGIQPKYFDKILGKIARKEIKEDTLIKFEDLR